MEETFRVDDVLAMAREVASHNNPHIEEHHNSAPEAVCDYCNGRSKAWGNDAKLLAGFKHNLNCVYLIAKDMLTGYQ